MEDLKKSSDFRKSGMISYPDISEESANRHRCWASRILYLLPQVLSYRTRKFGGCGITTQTNRTFILRTYNQLWDYAQQCVSWSKDHISYLGLIIVDTIAQIQMPHDIYIYTSPILNNTILHPESLHPQTFKCLVTMVLMCFMKDTRNGQCLHSRFHRCDDRPLRDSMFQIAIVNCLNLKFVILGGMCNELALMEFQICYQVTGSSKHIAVEQLITALHQFYIWNCLVGYLDPNKDQYMCFVSCLAISLDAGSHNNINVLYILLLFVATVAIRCAFCYCE